MYSSGRLYDKRKASCWKKENPFASIYTKRWKTALAIALIISAALFISFGVWLKISSLHQDKPEAVEIFMVTAPTVLSISQAEGDGVHTGAARVIINLDADGNPVGASAVSGPAELYTRSEAAAMQGPFSPKRVDGQGVPAKVAWTFHYNLVIWYNDNIFTGLIYRKGPL